MTNRRLVVAAVLVGASVLAFLLSMLLLQSTALATAAAAVLVGTVILLIDPFIGLVIYLLFLYVRPQEYMPGLVGAPIMLVLGGATFALMILHMAIYQRTIVFTKSPQNGLILWFLAAIAASHLSRLALSPTLDETLNFMPTVVMYFLVANLVNTPRKLKFTIVLLVLLTTVLAVQGLVQSFTGAGLGGQETYEGRIQAVGIFSDPNDLALALVIVLPWVFLKLFESPRGLEKAFATVVMAVLVYALYLTASRGGLLAFAALMMILLVRRFGRVPGLVAGGLVFMAVLVLGPRMSSISTGEASAYGRVQAWGIGLDLFEAYPLFGVGARNFTEYHFRTAHNSYVLCAAELGLFGLYPWVLAIYLSIKNNQYIARHLHRSPLRDVALYVDTVRYGLIAFVLAAYFLSRTYNELLFILLGLSAAITHIFIAHSSERYVLIERRDFASGLLWTIVGWLLTKLFLYTAW
ncbi:MAG: O-antigen ligase family protein [Candidatus Krumholzibacteria bacterium]|nr:O-antigen ligase family protein [Candidatus Krumholzibacteria bacterium]